MSHIRWAETANANLRMHKTFASFQEWQRHKTGVCTAPVYITNISADTVETEAMPNCISVHCTNELFLGFLTLFDGNVDTWFATGYWLLDTLQITTCCRFWHLFIVKFPRTILYSITKTAKIYANLSGHLCGVIWFSQKIPTTSLHSINSTHARPHFVTGFPIFITTYGDQAPIAAGRTGLLACGRRGLGPTRVLW